MSPYFWCDWVANLVGGLVANVVGGLVAGLVIVCVAEMTFGLRKERERRKKENAAQLRRALTHLELLRSEVEQIASAVPDQANRVKLHEWGMPVPIVTPVWDLLEQSGELVSLVTPRVLRQTAWFYEQLAYAKHLLDFLQLSWLVPEETVADIKGKRREMGDVVAGFLKTAESSAKELRDSLKSEIALLEDHLQGLG